MVRALAPSGCPPELPRKPQVVDAQQSESFVLKVFRFQKQHFSIGSVISALSEAELASLFLSLEPIFKIVILHCPHPGAELDRRHCGIEQGAPQIDFGVRW